MIRTGRGGPLALLVRDRPYRRRAARTDLDTALAAAAMDLDLELYFLGSAVLQLADDRDSSAALLPPGYRGWSTLPDLAEVRAFAEEGWLQRCRRDGIGLVLPVHGLDAAAMAARWRACDHALLL